VLRELAVAVAERRAVVADGEGAHAGGPGVDGEDCHEPGNLL